MHQAARPEAVAPDVASAPSGRFPRSPSALSSFSSEFDPFLRAVASGDDVVFDLWRREPVHSPLTGRRLEGYLERRRPPFSLADLKERHGGGTYRIVVRRGALEPEILDDVRVAGEPNELAATSSPHLAGAVGSFGSAGGGLAPTSHGVTLDAQVESAVSRALERFAPALSAALEEGDDEPEDVDPFSRTEQTVTQMVNVVERLKGIAGETPPPATKEAAFIQSIPEGFWQGLKTLAEAIAYRIAPHRAPAAAPAEPMAPRGSPGATAGAGGVPSQAGDLPFSPASSAGDPARRRAILEALSPVLDELADAILSHLETGEPKLADKAAEWRRTIPDLERHLAPDVVSELLKATFDRILARAKEAGKNLEDVSDRGLAALEFFLGRLLS